MYHVKLLEPIVNSRFFLAKRKLAMNKSRLIETENHFMIKKKKESAVNSLYPLHQWSYFIFLPYFILPYPALLKLGRNDPGTKRLRVVTTHQIRSNQSVERPGPKRPRAETPGPYSMAWSYISFKYEKIMADEET